MGIYLASLNPMTLVRALPGNVAQGIIWGIMALGVYITFRILDFADLTVDGSLATGGAVAVMLIWYSGNSGKYFDTDRIIFCKSWDYGKIKSGNQCASIQTGCISSICYRRRKRIFLCQTDSGSNCTDCNYLLVFRNRAWSCYPCDRM